MNLHEECLIKYLINPVDLFDVTEFLKLTNSQLEMQLMKPKRTTKGRKVNYTEA